MQNILYIALGGIIGTICRYAVSGASLYLSNSSFPLGTFIVNITGSFIIGFLWVVISPENISPQIRNMIFIGLLGSFTTFSSYALESLKLAQSGNYALALVYIIGSNVIGLLLVFLGYSLAKAIN